MQIDYEVKKGKIIRLVIVDSKGITPTSLRSISFKDLIRENKTKKFIKPASVPRLNKAADLIIKHAKEYEVDVLVKNMNLSPKVARNYVSELKREGVIKWT